MLVPVILAGGNGTRLWPLSREAYPKQFNALLEGKSLFQKTLERLEGIQDCSAPYIVANEQHRFLISEQISQSSLERYQLILEPALRGTAPAVALAALQALTALNDDVLLLVLPADHVVGDNQAFERTVMVGKRLAQEGKLVTFGVPPTRPETGYGYIQKGIPFNRGQGYQVKNFTEKPDLRTAQKYVASGDFCWNSGMFLFSAGAYLQELLLHAPQMYEATKRAYQQAKVQDEAIQPDRKQFEKSPSDSIDYAVMEKTSNAAVVPLLSPWSDLGAWDALLELLPADEAGNVCRGDVFVRDAQNCFVQSAQRLLVCVGTQNLVVVETPDAVLVMDKGKAQELKPLVNEMRAQARKEVVFHQKVNRPWGAFESIDEGERFQVKRITVSVGQRLSLQRHHHRSEHWVVVKGTARVTRGEECFLLAENQSTYIPIGVAHRLENVGKIPLEIIEVQSGAYLGEDDIVRLDDEYGRSEKLDPKEEAIASAEV